MTSNTYYNPSGNPAFGSEGLSALVRAEFAAIGAAFNLVPLITTTGPFSTTFNQQGNYTFTLPAAAGTLAMLSDVGAVAATVATETSARAAAVSAETTRATTAEAANATAISNETSTRATAITTEVTNRNTAIAVETTRGTTAEALLAPKLAPTITGLHETAIAMAALNLDCNAATIFTKTIVGISTLTVSNVPASGTSASFVLELTNGGAFPITWWAGVKWASGASPVLTAAGVDLLGFYTINGGTTWRGLVLARDVR
jgi:cell wall-associated NlpC family hydrolase